jgi:hypothetical protein
MNKALILLLIILAGGCSAGTVNKGKVSDQPLTVLNTGEPGNGPVIQLEFIKGQSFYYPLMAAWLEDESGKYVQTLYVAESVAKGLFKYGKQEKNSWVAAPKRAPQTLPYWAHKRGIRASDGLFMPEPANPVADSYSGATPTGSFVINARADKALPETFRVLFEINQNWDWNEYWTNNKYPDDENYKMSCQPALVYEAVLNRNNLSQKTPLRPIGHSHYSGKTGELFRDLSTLTTAMHIADSVLVRVK